MSRKRAFRLVMFFALIWVLISTYQLLGDAADAISRTNQEIEIKTHMNRIAKFVMIDYSDTGKIPTTTRELNELILQNYQANHLGGAEAAVRDLWGGSYRLAFGPKGFRVLSAGPDRRWRTGDDIMFYQDLTNVGYRGEYYKGKSRK